MLYDIQTMKPVSKLPHERDFQRWCAHMSASDFQAMKSIPRAGCLGMTGAAHHLRRLPPPVAAIRISPGNFLDCWFFTR